jgi:hypothetical protein
MRDRNSSSCAPAASHVRARLITAAAAVLLAATLCGAAGAAEGIQISDDGQGVRGLLYARPFTLEQPYQYLYTKEQPEITSGYILVLEVDPTFALPRQVHMPVLFVGTRPAELTNFGAESGRVVVLVPGDTDLASSPMFYGDTELPERIDAARGIEERDLALDQGITPFSQEEIDAALQAGGSPLAAVSIDGVYREVADLILAYAPEDVDTANGYKLIPADR